MKITEALQDATLYTTEAAAIEAGEDFCHANFAEHSRSNVDAAHAGKNGWVAVITREGETFDHFVCN